MGAMASQIIDVWIVHSNVCSGTDQRKHQSSVSLAFVRGIHRWPVYSPHKGPQHGKCSHLMTSSWEHERGKVRQISMSNLGRHCSGYITFGQCIKTITNNWKPIENSSPLCQTYIPTFVKKYKPKFGPPHWRKMVHSRLQTPQGEYVAKPGNSWWLSSI